MDEPTVALTIHLTADHALEAKAVMHGTADDCRHKASKQREEFPLIAATNLFHAALAELDIPEPVHPVTVGRLAKWGSEPENYLVICMKNDWVWLEHPIRQPFTSHINNVIDAGHAGPEWQVQG